jgi:hypothetical protein
LLKRAAGGPSGRLKLQPVSERSHVGQLDEYHLIISPIIVGGGKQSLPNHVLLKLDLLAERRFGNGVVHLHYRPKTVS